MVQRGDLGNSDDGDICREKVLRPTYKVLVMKVDPNSASSRWTLKQVGVFSVH
jgi:hypothetical protein